MAQIPFDDLQRAAKAQRERGGCPECGRRQPVEPCPEHDAIRCSVCGWERDLTDDS